MIKRILALRHVCKKYGLNYKIKWTGEHGAICWRVTGNEFRYEWIEISVFAKHFWAILFHEVGHFVAKRTLQYQNKHCMALGQDYKWGTTELYTLLAEEATASKFSNRMLKGADNQFLKDCWYSYTAYAAKYTKTCNLDKYVSTVSKYNKYFEGK